MPHTGPAPVDFIDFVETFSSMPYCPRCKSSWRRLQSRVGVIDQGWMSPWATEISYDWRARHATILSNTYICLEKRHVDLPYASYLPYALARIISKFSMNYETMCYCFSYYRRIGRPEYQVSLLTRRWCSDDAYASHSPHSACIIMSSNYIYHIRLIILFVLIIKYHRLIWFHEYLTTPCFAVNYIMHRHYTYNYATGPYSFEFLIKHFDDSGIISFSCKPKSYAVSWSRRCQLRFSSLLLIYIMLMTLCILFRAYLSRRRHRPIGLNALVREQFSRAMRALVKIIRKYRHWSVSFMTRFIGSTHLSYFGIQVE